MPQSAKTSLRLFGHIECVTPDGLSANGLLSQPKIVAVLALLAVPSIGRFVRRDTIVGLLWPELDQAHARAALRKAVHATRAALGSEAILARGDEDIALSEHAIWCDASAFIVATDSVALSQALELYRGDLMPGFHLSGAPEFDQWLSGERLAARERAAAASWALAQTLEGTQDFTNAGRYARRAVRLADNDERALRRALVMLVRLGDQAGAVRLFEEFARQLQADLDMKPSAETLRLVGALRA